MAVSLLLQLCKLQVLVEEMPVSAVLVPRLRHSHCSTCLRPAIAGTLLYHFEKISFCLLTLLTLFRSGLSVLLQRDLLLNRLPGPGDIILVIVMMIMMMIIMVVIKPGPGDRGYDCCARTKQRGK